MRFVSVTTFSLESTIVNQKVEIFFLGNIFLQGFFNDYVNEIIQKNITKKNRTIYYHDMRSGEDEFHMLSEIQNFENVEIPYYIKSSSAQEELIYSSSFVLFEDYSSLDYVFCFNEFEADENMNSGTSVHRIDI